MNKTDMENIKDQLAEDLKKINDAVNFSSLINVKSEVLKAVDNAKENTEKHITALSTANEQADQAIDPWIEKAQSSRFTPLYVAFLFLSGFAAGIGLGIHL